MKNIFIENLFKDIDSRIKQAAAQLNRSQHELGIDKEIFEKWLEEHDREVAERAVNDHDDEIKKWCSRDDGVLIEKIKSEAVAEHVKNNPPVDVAAIEAAAVQRHIDSGVDSHRKSFEQGQVVGKEACLNEIKKLVDEYTKGRDNPQEDLAWRAEYKIRVYTLNRLKDDIKRAVEPCEKSFQG